MTGRIDIERRGRVLVLTINDPPSRNALSMDMMGRGREAIDEVVHDASVGAIVIVGAEGIFSSGGHLIRLYDHVGKSRVVQRDGIERFHSWIRCLRDCPKPVIAAVEGTAAGAGMALALACDLLVAAEDARFLTAYVGVGLTSDGGASLSLARALPPQLVAEMLLTGEPMTPQRLAGLGVVNRVVPTGTALEAAVTWAAKIADGPQAAIGRLKKLIELAYGGYSTQLARESDAFVEALHHPEADEAISAFFQKRPPKFR